VKKETSTELVLLTKKNTGDIAFQLYSESDLDVDPK
jgi:hypothetical protein